MADIIPLHKYEDGSPSFGPRERSPNVNYTTRRLTDPVAEAKRVHEMVVARLKEREELEAAGCGGLK